MRISGLALLLLLAACSGGTSLSNNQPGLDVADAALRGGSPQVALQIAAGVLARSPNDVRALVMQGDALTTLGQYEPAADSYTRALKADHGSVGAQIGLGRLRLARDPAAAEALFDQAVAEDPRNTTALNDLGVARDLQGRHADAQQAYAKALGIDPEMHAAQVNLALSLAMTGNAGRAEQLLRPLASSPDASRKLRHDLAAVLAMSGKQAEAERILSADLSPTEVRQALEAYAAARSGSAPAPLLTGDGAQPPAPVPPPSPSGTPAQPRTQRGPSSAITPSPLSAVPSATATGAALPRLAAAALPALPNALAADPASPALSGIQVQFSASPSEAAAQAEWQRLENRMPDLLSGREPAITKVERDGHVFWRLRTNGFDSQQDAQAFCSHAQVAGASCVVLRS